MLRLRRVGEMSLLVLGISLAGWCRGALGQELSIDSFAVSEAKGVTTVAMTVSAHDAAKLGSFGVRFADKGGPSGLPEFDVENQGYFYLRGEDYPSHPSLHFDNGKADLDPQPGVIKFTIDHSKWPEGIYRLVVFVCNRPATGAYYGQARGLTIIVGNAKPEQPNAPDLTNVVIYKQRGVYACFPELFRLDGNTLITAFGTRIRASHIDNRGGTRRMISHDAGKTWQETDLPMVNPAAKLTDKLAVSAGADGWQYVPADKRAELTAAQRIIMDVRPGTIAYLGGAHAARSEDGGRTWQRSAIPVPDWVAGLMTYHSSCSFIRTRRGVFLSAVYGKRKGDANDQVFFLRSADRGASWQFIPLVPGKSALSLNETALAEAPNNRLLAVIRCETDGYSYASTSGDGGLTWSAPKRTGFWGYPAHLTVLHNGDILCSYGYRRDDMGIRACISHDNGQTWDVKHEIRIRTDAVGSGSDTGYPISYQMADGSIFTIYYITTQDGITHIAGSHWVLP